jgi:hypothetical protein
MLDALLIFILIAVAGIWTFVGLRKLVQVVDRMRPRHTDWVAQHKRKIAKNGYRNGMGAR